MTEENMPRASFHSYMICTTPRSGSTLLCKLLEATGVAGRPNSHFHAHSLLAWLSDFDLDRASFASEEDAVRAVFEAAIARGRGNTSIFGLRMQRGSFDHFIRRLGNLYPDRPNDQSRISSAFGPTLYVHLTRSDRLAQAISRLRAEQSGLWHKWADGTDLERRDSQRPSRYDADAIGDYIAELTDLDAAWASWFLKEGIDPLEIKYEDLAENPHTILADVLAALGLDPKAASTVGIPTARLSDEKSRTWRARYEAEN